MEDSIVSNEGYNPVEVIAQMKGTLEAIRVIKSITYEDITEDLYRQDKELL